MGNTLCLKKYSVEYAVRANVRLLYNYLLLGESLELWFADKVIVKDNNYRFFWNGAEQQAKLVAKKEHEYVRYKWTEDEDDEAYFEFKISFEPITNDIALIITDFADESEITEAKRLWDANIHKLLRALGS